MLIANEADQLLYVLSARQKIQWETFKAIVDKVLVDRLSQSHDLPFLRTQVLRALDALGHCDCVFGKGIYIAPATIVVLPKRDKTVAVLAGLRTPALLAQLEEKCTAAKVTLTCYPQKLATSVTPCTAKFEAESFGDLKAVADAAKLVIDHEPVAWKLAHFAASLDDYKEASVFTQGGEINWRKSDFNPDLQRFGFSSTPGNVLRLSRYLDPKKNKFKFWLWRGDQYCEVSPDWARYWVMQECNVDVLYYDKNTAYLAHPVTTPLPRLLERALTLCSGNAPEVRRLKGGKTEYLLFSEVPEEVASLIATKVSQTLMRCNLSQTFEDDTWTIQ